MQTPQYLKEGLQQYVFFPLEAIPEGDYINQLFQYHKVPGFLNYEIKSMNNQQYVYYFLQYKSSLRFAGEYMTFTEDIVRNMVCSIVDIIQASKDFLLSFHHIIWSMDYIFIHIETGKLLFCYSPVSLEDNSISSFLSDFIKLAGKKNERSTVLILQLYNCITEPGFCEKQLDTFRKMYFQETSRESLQENIEVERKAEREKLGKENEKEEKPKKKNLQNKEQNQKKINKKEQNKKERTGGKFLKIGILIFAGINVVLLCLFVLGILSAAFFPWMVVLLGVFCLIVMFSVSDNQEEDVDMIMQEYFKDLDLKDEKKERNTFLEKSGIHNENPVYGETSLLIPSNEENNVVVEEYPKDLCLYPQENDKYPLLEISNHSVVIGCMKENCDYVLSGRGISRLHAKILKTETALYLLDLNSTNGTYLNGEPLENGKEYLLEKGDLVAFAQIQFYVTEKNENNL